MVNSAIQLKKYKKILAKLEKDYPNKNPVMGFTVNLCYGGNKEVDISRIELGGVSSRPNLNKEFLALIFQAVEDNIKFWTDCVERDIKELKHSLE